MNTGKKMNWMVYQSCFISTSPAIQRNTQFFLCVVIYLTYLYPYPWGMFNKSSRNVQYTRGVCYSCKQQQDKSPQQDCRSNEHSIETFACRSGVVKGHNCLP